MLDVATYDAAETAAIKQFSNRIRQAFYPEMFATVGYPTRVAQTDELWRYIDVLHETRTNYNMEHILHGLTTEEFELYKRVTRIVDEHAKRHFGMRAYSSASLLRAIHVLRLIKIATGSGRPTVLEVGPGCGYLGMLLVMEGYPYVSTDVVQAFYLQQSHMLSYVATTLRELAAEGGDILTIDQPKAGTAIHIPWWKWITLTPEKVKLSAGILTSNHVLCEMHPSSMAYLALLGHRILSNHAGSNGADGGKFIFENWGYDLLHSRETVLNKFQEHGFRLCHDEYAMSAMVLRADMEHWLQQEQSPPTISVSLPEPKASVEPDWWRRARRRTGAILNHAPPVKRFAVHLLQFPSRSRSAAKRLAVYLQSLSRSRSPLQPQPQVVDNGSETYPLTRRLIEGRRAVIASTTVGQAELEAFLASYFNGVPPRWPDEVFFDLIGTRQ